MSYSREVSDGFPENVMWENMEIKQRLSDTGNGQRKRWEMEKTHVLSYRREEREKPLSGRAGNSGKRRKN